MERAELAQKGEGGGDHSGLENWKEQDVSRENHPISLAVWGGGPSRRLEGSPRAILRACLEHPGLLGSSRMGPLGLEGECPRWWEKDLCGLKEGQALNCGVWEVKKEREREAWRERGKEEKEGGKQRGTWGGRVELRMSFVCFMRPFLGQSTRQNELESEDGERREKEREGVRHRVGIIMAFSGAQNFQLPSQLPSTCQGSC